MKSNAPREQTDQTLDDLEGRLAQASSYEDWQQAAREHDRLSGMDAWKQTDESDDYDYADIGRRLQELRDLRARGDDMGLLFVLNEGIHGNMSGIGQSSLYEAARFGTKQLIVAYVDELIDCLKHVSSLPESDITWQDKLDFFERASHCFGRSALMLSGAGSLLHFHAGVVKTLIDENLLPTVVSGSSGGALIAGVLGTHDDDELHAFFASGALAPVCRQIFGEPNWRFRRPQIKAAEAYRLVELLVADLTFQEALEKTGRMINITIASVEKHQASRLMNATTSPNVYVRSAVLASCAAPGVLDPQKLSAKNVRGEPQPYLPDKSWVDGAVTDDLPAKRLARLYGVNHYIVSQANPFSLLLLKSDELWPGPKAVKDVWRHASREWLRAGEQFSRRYLGPWPGVGQGLNMFYSLYAQDYTGDINIAPSFRLVDPRKVLGHLKASEIEELYEEGRRATWPRLEQIRIATNIGQTLDVILDHHADHDVRKIYRKRADGPRKKFSR